MSILLGNASPAATTAAAAVLLELPRSVLAVLIASGARIVLEPVAVLHHRDGTLAAGIASPYPLSARIAAAREPEAVAAAIRHEVAHLLDYLQANGGRGHRCCLSATLRWQDAWRREVEADRIYRIDAWLDPAEHFADCFAAYFGSDRVRATLSPAVRRFLAELFFP